MKKANQQLPSQRNIGQSFTIQNNITQLPDYTDKPRVISKKGVKVLSTTSNNLFPQIVSKIVKESSTLKAVINSFADYVSYGEVVASDAFKSKLIMDFNKYYDWHEFSKRVAKDRRTYGYGFIEEVRIGKEVYLYHLDASTVRFVEYLGESPEFVAISKDWNDTKISPSVLSLYPEYTIDGNQKRRIITIMDYETGLIDYPFPIWSGAFYDAQVESLIGQYNANQFENGITLSSILFMDAGDVTNASELKEFKKKIEFELKGTSNGRSGKTLVIPKVGDVLAPEYVQYPMDKEGSYLELQKMVENNIVKACSWFRSLAGLESAGSMGNNQQLRNEWEQAEKLVRNEQDKIMQVVLKAYENTPHAREEVFFNNQSPMNLVNDMATIKDLLSNKETIGVNTITHLLGLMGMDLEQAKKVANDSE